jgi:hypothetical protein
MESKNVAVAVLIIALVLLGSFVLWNKAPAENPPITPDKPADTTPTQTTAPDAPAGPVTVCTDPANKYSIVNNNACKNANELATCKLDLNNNGAPDVDDICGKGFQKCCCTKGYSNCC